MLQRRGISIGTSLFLCAVIFAILAWRGWSFYTLELSERVTHLDYDELKPSGTVGYGYGVAGTLFILANLLYLIRRKLARFNLGSMKTWLDVHVVTGLVGGVFVLFHSSFQARSPINQTLAVAVAVVIVTGLIGRYLKYLLPNFDRTTYDDALRDLGELLPGIDDAVDSAVSSHVTHDVPHSPSLLQALRARPYVARVARDRRDSVRDIIAQHILGADLSKKQIKRAKKLARRIARQAEAQTMLGISAALLRSWRSLHRFFALLMVSGVVLHASIAWYYGFRWIFAE